MVKFDLNEVQDEHILGQSIFSPNGDLLLAAGNQITERYRKRLRQLGFSHVMVELEGTEGIEPETTVSEKVQKEVSGSLRQASKDIHQLFKFKRHAKSSASDIIKGNKNNIQMFIKNSGIGKALERLIDELLGKSSIVLNLQSMEAANEGFFNHVMNVAIISICIGRKYRFGYDELHQLGMGALNYDIGLIAVDQSILTKPGPLNGEEIAEFQRHSEYGHMMLSQNPHIAPTSSIVALQHHEFQDGTGYPGRLRGENRPPLKDLTRQNVIHRFAEIVGVADMYDRLCNGRFPQDHKFEPRKVLRKIIQMGGVKLNADIVKTLTTIVPIYPVGAKVRIIDSPIPQLLGLRGVVAKDNPEKVEAPLIVMYESRNHKKIKPFVIDMAKHNAVKIELIT